MRHQTVHLPDLRILPKGCGSGQHLRRWQPDVLDDDVQVKGAECVVMAGDPCQLPPTVLSPPTSEAAHELQYTLYARLADAGESAGSTSTPSRSVLLRLAGSLFRNAAGFGFRNAAGWTPSGSSAPALSRLSFEKGTLRHPISFQSSFSWLALSLAMQVAKAHQGPMLPQSAGSGNEIAACWVKTLQAHIGHDFVPPQLLQSTR